MHVFGGDVAGLGDGGCEECVVGEEVGAPGEPAGGLVDGLDGRGLEDGVVAAGEAQMVLEVGVRLGGS